MRRSGKSTALAMRMPKIAPDAPIVGITEGKLPKKTGIVLTKSSMSPAPTPQMQKLALPPNKLQFAAEHPQHEHINQQVEKAAMQKNVGKGLPNARRDVVRYGFGNERKPFEQPDGCRGRSKQAQKSLQKENTRADQYEEF